MGQWQKLAGVTENEEYDSDIQNPSQVLGTGVTQTLGKDCCMKPPPSLRTPAFLLQASLQASQVPQQIQVP